VTASTEDGQLVGKLLALDDENLTLQVGFDTPPRVLPREHVTDLAVSADRGSWVRGTLIGAGIGAAAGALIGFALGDDKQSDNNAGDVDFTAEDKALFGVILGAPIGALIGLSVPPFETWIDVPPDRIRMSLRPNRGGGAAGSLTVAF
jgi:hypothetical protein